MIDEISRARDERKGRDIEREMDAAVIRDCVASGSSSQNFKLLREFKAAAQSFVDLVDGMQSDSVSESMHEHAEWFRELLK